MKFRALHIILFICISLSLQAQNREAMLKAGFLEKFARFSEWPNNMGSSFDIYIIGKPIFNDELERLYNDVTVKELPVKIHYIQSVYEINSGEMLFISHTDKNHLQNILTEIRDKPILTVSDSKGFAKQGVHINFFTTAQNTIHFEINTKTLDLSGIKMDIMLLDFAKIIN